MDLLQQQSYTIADWGWQEWAYVIVGLLTCMYIYFNSHLLYKKVIGFFERKYNVTITARYKYYDIKGPYSWVRLTWIEIKLMAAFFMVYFAPLLLVTVTGLLLGIYEN